MLALLRSTAIAKPSPAADQEPQQGGIVVGFCQRRRISQCTYPWATAETTVETTVVPLGEEELHLVAMLYRKNDKQYLCFWGFNVAPVLYNSCLVMLNLRCLGMVFVLDETLVVVNTMRSFEDQIDALQRKINTEVDPQRITGMLAEVKRYKDAKIILKQYA
ncbi:PREDICTED: RNA polymerase II C-terminal domain phosphatase-like 1 isoform X1 [Nelumbo nucifera]|uniref:RNA polymerase II C-terminal domain phosphatase-like 1 isoform X1 n=1 Tax=Nelumbo nucifera TaxID=4432 RepID=A0A1U8Q166_NELNU|nr:PREDICTED: RNA polymerase II C-terminal domain phosphatase-like 1 isoform X1 [Nelumbo nucifera]